MRTRGLGTTSDGYGQANELMTTLFWLIGSDDDKTGRRSPVELSYRPVAILYVPGAEPGGRTICTVSGTSSPMDQTDVG